MWSGASAAAPPSVLASLAPRQRGVGGRMLGSNFNPISLGDTQNTETNKTNMSKPPQAQERRRADGPSTPPPPPHGGAVGGRGGGSFHSTSKIT